MTSSFDAVHSKQDMIFPGLYPGPSVYAGPGFHPKFYGTSNNQPTLNNPSVIL